MPGRCGMGVGVVFGDLYPQRRRRRRQSAAAGGSGRADRQKLRPHPLDTAQAPPFCAALGRYRRRGHRDRVAAGGTDLAFSFRNFLLT